MSRLSKDTISAIVNNRDGGFTGMLKETGVSFATARRVIIANGNTLSDDEKTAIVSDTSISTRKAESMTGISATTIRRRRKELIDTGSIEQKPVADKLQYEREYSMSADFSKAGIMKRSSAYRHMKKTGIIQRRKYIKHMTREQIVAKAAREELPKMLKDKDFANRIFELLHEYESEAYEVVLEAAVAIASADDVDWTDAPESTDGEDA